MLKLGSDMNWNDRYNQAVKSAKMNVIIDAKMA